MKRIIFLIALLPFTGGCRQLQRLYKAESFPIDKQELPEIYTITGKAMVDYQTIKPVRCDNSTIRVWVRKQGALDFRELNKYEWRTKIANSVEFRRECRPTYDSNGNLILLTITGGPAVPIGSDYRIESMLLTK